MKWTKLRPKSPSNGELSLFYWYKEEDTEKVWIVELWPSRDVKRYKGMWSDSAIPRPEGVAIPPPVLDAPNSDRRGKGIL